MPNIYDITIEKGSTFGLTLVATDSAGVPLNFSGYSASGQIRYGYGSDSVLAYLSGLVDPSYVSGLVHVYLPASQSVNLPVTVAMYDIEVSNSDGSSVFKAIKGFANIVPEVTHYSLPPIIQFQPGTPLQGQIDTLSGIVSGLQEQLARSFTIE